MPGPRRAAGPVLVLALAAAGCGRGEGDVVGKVTYRGKPAQNVALVFQPPGKPAVSCPVADDGTYRQPALPVGDVPVAVLQYNPHGDGKPPPWAANPIPRRYASVATSGLTAAVRKGDNSFDVALE